MTEKEKLFSKKYSQKTDAASYTGIEGGDYLDNYDHPDEQRVWQRVHACQEEGRRQDLRQLQREAMELAAIYRRLFSVTAGRPREQLMKLYRGERSNAEMLAGIGKLSRSSGENLKLWDPGKEEPAKALERCYHRSRRCMTEYLSRSAEGEFGVVFEKLAKREAEHCTVIAEVLGSI